jgi:hypothetical protein
MCDLANLVHRTILLDSKSTETRSINDVRPGQPRASHHSPRLEVHRNPILNDEQTMSNLEPRKSLAIGAIAP